MVGSNRGGRWRWISLVVATGSLALGCGGGSAGGSHDAAMPIVGDPDRGKDAAATIDVARGLDAGALADASTGPDGSADGSPGDGYPPPTPVPTQPCRLLGIGAPTSMDLSPDGTLAVFGSSAGGVTLIPMASFVARRTITAHAASVTAVAFSSDSATVVSGDAEGNISLWSVADGGALWTAPPVGGPVQTLAFSPSGTLWALTPAGLVAVNGRDGTHAAATAGTSATIAALSPDGRTIALGDPDGGFRVLRASDLSTLAAVAGAHPGGVTALRISANGQRMVTGGADGTTALWDLQGSLIARVPLPGAPVTSVDLDADGSILVAAAATSEYAGAFKPDGTVLTEAITFPIYARLSLDGGYVVTMTNAFRADRVPIDTNDLTNTLVWQDYFQSVAFSPDGRYLAEGVDDDVRLWDTETGEMVRILDTTAPPLYTPPPAIAFSPDGATLALNDGNYGTYLLDVADSALVASYPIGRSQRSLVYSPDGQWLATTGPSAIVLLRVSDGSSGPTTFVGSTGQTPTAVAFSSDGATLAVGDAGGMVSLWSFPAGALIERFAALSTRIQQIAFSADGTRLAVADPSGVQVLFTPSGTKIASLATAGSPSFSFSADGMFVANVAPGPGVPGPYGGTVHYPQLTLWSPATGMPLLGLVPQSPGDSTLYYNGEIVDFAPSGHRVLAADFVGRIFCVP